MAHGTKRKRNFILGLFVLLGLGAAFLMFWPIPAPVAEKTVELDASHVLQ